MLELTLVKSYTVIRCMFIILKGTVGPPGDQGFNGTKVSYNGKVLCGII